MISLFMQARWRLTHNIQYLSVFNVRMDNNYYADIYYCINIMYTEIYETFTLTLIKKPTETSRKKHFEKRSKHVGMTMPKSIQTRCQKAFKQGVGMEVCSQGRGA